MVNFEKVANDIFDLLKGHNYDIVIYDKKGSETVSPEDGRRFFVEFPNRPLLILDVRLAAQYDSYDDGAPLPANGYQTGH